MTLMEPLKYLETSGVSLSNDEKKNEPLQMNLVVIYHKFDK